MRALVTLCVAVVTVVGHVVNPRGACNADNCLRAIQNPSRTDAASQVCSSVLATSLPPTATASLPSWVGNCGGNVSRISSACSCFQGATSSGPTSSPTSSVPSSTTSKSSTTCPAPSTITATLTLPCATTSSTSTCHASTITVPGPTAISTLTLACSSSSASTCAASTVTASATTVTQPASTVTLTSTATRTVEVPQPSSCAQVIANGGFERADRNFFPWLIAGNGGGALAQDCITCTVYFQLRGIHSPTLLPAVQFVQAFPFCAGNYQLRFKFRSNNSLTWRAQAQLVLTGSSTLERSKTIAYPAVGTRTFEVVSFDQFNLPAGGQRGEVWLTIIAEGQNTGERVIEVDDIELVRV